MSAVSFPVSSRLTLAFVSYLAAKSLPYSAVSFVVTACWKSPANVPGTPLPMRIPGYRLRDGDCRVFFEERRGRIDERAQAVHCGRTDYDQIDRNTLGCDFS